jgi:hypothetical protein
MAIRNALTVFALADRRGRLALGLAGRIAWAKFGIEADVGASRLPYVLTAGFVNDLVESLYLFAPFALYILLLPDRWFRSTANR